MMVLLTPAAYALCATPDDINGSLPFISVRSDSDKRHVSVNHQAELVEKVNFRYLPVHVHILLQAQVFVSKTDEWPSCPQVNYCF